MASPKQQQHLRPAAEAKPMARVEKIALFRQRMESWIAPPALGILLNSGEIISEGQFDTDGNGTQVYLGSSLVLVPLAQLGGFLRGPLDAASARRFVALLEGDKAARKALAELALREAEKVAGCPLFNPQVEVDASHEGDTLRLHLDVEARVTPRRAGRRRR